jgi:hypothetical protein
MKFLKSPVLLVLFALFTVPMEWVKTRTRHRVRQVRNPVHSTLTTVTEVVKF